jgi:hypothetical protein
MPREVDEMTTNVDEDHVAPITRRQLQALARDDGIVRADAADSPVSWGEQAVRHMALAPEDTDLAVRCRHDFLELLLSVIQSVFGYI